MQLTNQTVDVAKIRYRMEWQNTPSGDNGGSSFDVSVPFSGSGFLALADQFAKDVFADQLSSITHTSATYYRAFLGAFETTEVTVP